MTISNLTNQYRNLKEIYIMSFDENGKLQVDNYYEKVPNEIKDIEVRDYEKGDVWIELWV